MKKYKSGFTIVELIIVIAVIGILIAILIPVFSNIIRKANNAADVSACKNMNVVLISERDVVHDENVGFIEACMALHKAGFSVGKVVPKVPENRFYYDTVIGKVLLVDSTTEEVTFPKDLEGRTAADATAEGGRWILLIKPFADIATEAGMAMAGDYSIISDTVISLKESESYTLDLGGNTLNLNNKSLIIIGDGTVNFTNGGIANGQIVVNMPNGRIDYSAQSYESVNWNIMSIADHTMAVKSGASVDGRILLQKGHVKIESGGRVANITIPNGAINTKVTVEYNASLLCLNVEPGAVSTSVQNNGKISYFDGSINAGTNQDGSSPVHYNSKSNDILGGTGSDDDAYLIGSSEQFNKLYDRLAAVTDGECVYVKLLNSIDFTGKTINNASITNVKVSINIDGRLPNGKSATIRGIYNFNGQPQLFPEIINSYIKNIDFYFGGNEAAIANAAYGTCIFENVNTYGKIKTNAQYGSAFVQNPKRLVVDSIQLPAILTYKDCANYADIEGGSSTIAAPFGAETSDLHTAGYFTINNCSNYGTIQGNKASAFVGNIGGTLAERYRLQGKNSNFGNIYGKANAGLFSHTTSDLDSKINNEGYVGTISTIGLSAPTSIGDSIIVPNQAGAAKYVVSVLYTTNLYNFSGMSGWNGGFVQSIEKTYNAPQSGDLTTDFKKLYIAEANQSKLDYQKGTIVEYNGVFVPEGFRYDSKMLISSHKDKIFYYATACDDGYYGLLNSSQINDPSQTYTITVAVKAYNESGLLIATGSFDYSYTINEARQYFDQD